MALSEKQINKYLPLIDQRYFIYNYNLSGSLDQHRDETGYGELFTAVRDVVNDFIYSLPEDGAITQKEIDAYNESTGSKLNIRAVMQHTSKLSYEVYLVMACGVWFVTENTGRIYAPKSKHYKSFRALVSSALKETQGRITLRN